MTDQVRQDDTHRTGRERTDANGRLARLDTLDDFEIADGQPDIRGWKVKAADGVEIGKVDGLIADPSAMEVRYMEVKIKKDLLSSNEDESVMIPISAARLNDDDDTVILHRLDSGRLREAPRIGSGPLTDDDDAAVILFFGPTQTTRDEDRDRFFGSRRKGPANQPYFTNRGRSTDTTNDARG